jgi:hypothetical protein
LATAPMIGGQAQVKGVGGTWKDLTDNVNLMAANLTGQVRNIAEVTSDLLGQVAVGHRGGDFGDVAHLARQVGRHQVHVVGQPPR